MLLWLIVVASVTVVVDVVVVYDFILLFVGLKKKHVFCSNILYQQQNPLNENKRLKIMAGDGGKRITRKKKQEIQENK